MRAAVILLLIFTGGGTGIDPLTIFTIGTGIITGIGFLLQIGSMFQQDPLVKDLHRRFGPLEDSIQGIEKNVNSISGLIRDMEQEMEQDSAVIIGLLKNMEQAVEENRQDTLSQTYRRQWDLTIETFESLLRDIVSPYDRFLLYQKNISAIEQYTLLQFANSVVSHESNSPLSVMYSMTDVVLGNARFRSRRETVSQPDTPGALRRRKRYTFRQGLFRQLETLMKASRLVVCGLGRSPQQMAYELYGTVVMALAKTYSMTEFAYQLLRLFEKGSFKAESEHFRESYRNISLAVTLEASTVMRQLDPVFWRCDPARHERGATYDEVTELLQGHIQNEVDLADGNCNSQCSVPPWIRSDTGRCHGAAGQPLSIDLFSGLLPSSETLCEIQRPCNGDLHNCRYVSESATVCLADPGRGAHRRYNWIQYSDGQVKGRKDDVSLGSCDKTPLARTLPSGCAPCFCLCEDDTHSERYFSLLPAVSDVAENKIVTGVRFVKLDGVFYIQLQQGQPDRMGHINRSTIQWKPIDPLINLTRDKEREHYVRLNHAERSVLLQDLRGSPGQVVTGVSLSIDNRRWPSPISLKIRVTGIADLLAGAPAKSTWLAEKIPIHRALAHLPLSSEPVPPFLSAARNWPDSRSGQVVKFEASSLDADAAQTTLPLLDVQEVAPRPAVWLTGVGLFHKGQPNGGGFIGLRVEMADMALTEEQRKAVINVSQRPELLNGTSLDQILSFEVHEDSRK